MNNIEFLISKLTENGGFHEKLCEILSSSSVEENKGNPRTVRVKFVRGLYIRRREALSSTNVETFGVDELIDRIAVLPDDTEVQSYSLKNDVYSGQCFIMDNVFMGCAFVRKGLSFSVRGLTHGD